MLVLLRRAGRGTGETISSLKKYFYYFEYFSKAINLDPGCMYEETVTHEILHALGFDHEQSRSVGKYLISIENISCLIFLRPDRDEHVKINWENIQPGKEGNFGKRTEAGIAEYMSYDFQSIMHYNSKAFSINGQNTIGEFIYLYFLLEFSC